jgi:beta-1,4-N-acetylglucosaminyltransferase
MKICIACSGGGHLGELLQIKKVYSKHNHYYVTFRRTDTEKIKAKKYFIERPARNPMKTLINFVQSAHILIKEKPSMVISNGADVAVFTCILAKILGKKVIYIEPLARPHDLSLSGKIIYPFSDLFIVQWTDHAKKYPKAIYGGFIYG